ncbi:MAG TPA: 16S rRNA (cytidine(1402)-2'-O)-methyltransferase [Gammaproteobacteria bacterium]|nr:16S rRNA (cytidine(1402)-2'-O)-methyltransferase [Gammaproteobacteria bacterium]
MSTQSGILYVVATPIGNLGDITRRAVQILSEVDFIAVEDTRRSRQLLNHLGIKKPMISLHEHNEQQQAGKLLARMVAGESMALVSDAGTPLISDPGYHLVRQAREQGLVVSPVPGASALMAAMSASGLPTDHFRFEGFLPNRQSARQSRLTELQQERMTLVFYESSHRIIETLTDMNSILGKDREAVLARELTKMYETFLGVNLGEILDALHADANQRKGEFVLVVRGQEKDHDRHEAESADPLLALLLDEMPIKNASRIVAKYLGLKKNDVYKRGLLIQGKRGE